MKQRFLYLLLACFVLASPAGAQQQAGVTGAVRDAEGGVLPGVTVTVKNQATNLTRVVTTSGDGRYSITGLPPGSYSVEAVLQGLAPFTQKELKLLVGTNATVNITMSPAGVEKTVTVTGERAVVETTESDVSTAISQELIANLPVAERNAISLALLVPGVSASPYFDPTKSRDNFDGFGFGANSGSENLILVDGGDNNDDVVGSILQFYPQDSIQEFEVITSRFKAEYGHTDGGVVNMITKSGTNTLAGGGYWLFRDDSLNAKTFVEEDTGAEKGAFRQNIAGGYLGGPVVADKMFFFGNYDWTKRPQEILLNTGGTVPEIDALGQVPQDFKQQLAVGKANWNASANNFVTARYAFQDDSVVNVNVLPTTSLDFGGQATNRYHAFLAKDQTVIGSDKLNEVFWQYNKFRNGIVSNAIGSPLENKTILLEGGVYALGQNPNHPQETLQDKHQLVDTFSWRSTAKGDHDFKAGVEYQHVKVGGQFTSGDPAVIFNWDTVDAYLSGAPADTATVTNGPGFFVGESRNNIFSFFLQDDWKPTDRLTLNLGLRYDLETNDWTQSSDKGELGPGRTFITSDPLFFGGQPGTDSNNFGPRAGFAYDVEGTGNFVVRGGYGLYFQQIFWNSPIRYPFFEGVLQTAADYVGPEVTFGPGDPFCAAGTSGAGCIPVPALPSADAADFVGNNALQGADPDARTPSTHQFSAGFATRLPGDLGLDVDFVHTMSDSQLYSTRAAHRAAIQGINTANMGTRALVDLNGAEQRYAGLLVSASKRFEKFSTQLSYTFGQGNGHVARQTGTISDDSDLGFDNNYGPNFAQRDHIFAGSLFYEFGRGFQVGTVVKLQSAYHFSGFDPNLGDIDADDRTTDTYADAAAGSTGGEGEKGDFTGDSFSQVDLRMSKTFVLANRYRPQVFFEVFNLFNARNEKPDSVVTNINNPLFGTSSQVAGQPFQAQLSLRLDF